MNERKRSRKVNKKVIFDYNGDKKLEINKYFDKIFIINLKDKTERFEKTTKQFLKKGIKYSRFDAIDGRCSNKKECRSKKKILEEKYNTKIKMKSIPAASLTMGTIEILKQQVKNKWKRILICEDDVELTRNIISRFSKSIPELEKIDYDLLYLGCGNQCGFRGLSEQKTNTNKYLTSLSIIKDGGFDFYVRYKNDLRLPCEKDYCTKLSENFSLSPMPGGTWAYVYTLKGAKKLLKYVNKTASDHIDQLIIKAIASGKLKAIAYDPPLIMHEAGAFRPDSDIDWEW
jgi:GR25 family glycosyltransferase involved in LPS biosynthesis